MNDDTNKKTTILYHYFIATYNGINIRWQNIDKLHYINRLYASVINNINYDPFLDTLMNNGSNAKPLGYGIKLKRMSRYDTFNPDWYNPFIKTTGDDVVEAHYDDDITKSHVNRRRDTTLIALFYNINRLMLGFKLANKLMSEFENEENYIIFKEAGFHNDEFNHKKYGNIFLTSIKNHCKNIVTNGSLSISDFDKLKDCYNYQKNITAPYNSHYVPNKKMQNIISQYIKNICAPKKKKLTKTSHHKTKINNKHKPAQKVVNRNIVHCTLFCTGLFIIFVIIAFFLFL